MPWACSERQQRRRPWLILPLALLPLLALPLAPAQRPARAGGSGSGWQLAAFPVLAFERYSAGFGHRRHPMLDGNRLHDGLDIAAAHGSPVRSWWRGRVIAVFDDRGCGLGVLIRSGDYEHLYCHLSGNTVGGTYHSSGVRLRPGDRVETGQLIGRVGSSGMATGPHLHWSLRWRGHRLDPAAVLRTMAAARAWPSVTTRSTTNLKFLR